VDVKQFWRLKTKMDLKNINKIMKSDLWKDIIKNPNYLDYKIVDTSKKGYYQMLVVFFDMDVGEKPLKDYLERGRRMIHTEGLDNNDILKTYGRVRILVYS